MSAGNGSTPMEGLTGKSQSQSQQGSTASHTAFDPNDLAALRAGQQGLIGQTGQVRNLANQLAGQVGPAPTLNQNFNQLQGVQAYQPGSQGLDSLGRQLVSQGTQGLAAQAGAQQRAYQQALGGQRGAGNVLARNAAMQSRLQANPLLFQAAQGSMQRGQQGFENRMGLAGQQAGLQQAGNQAALQQQQSGAANRQEQLGLTGAGLQAQQQLIPLLSAIAQQTGTQVTESLSEAKGRSGGLLGNFGVK